MKTTLTLLCAAVAMMLHGAVWAAGGDAAAGKQKAQACFACHGEDGRAETGMTPTPPRIAGQHEDYLIKAMEDYASGARQNPVMMGFSEKLTDEDRADIAAYFSGLDSSLHLIEHTD